VAAGISGLFLIFVMVADPVGEVPAGRFVAAVGRDVEEAVDGADVFGTTSKYRVCMENLPVSSLVKTLKPGSSSLTQSRSSKL
jgi:hypothetical protein